MVDKLLYIFTKIGQKLSKVSLVKSLQSLSVTAAKHSNDVKVKLRSLKLKKISDIVINWQSCWDQFLSSIYWKDNISHIGKFADLKSYLCDLVKASIPWLTLATQKYHQKIDLQKLKHANPKMIISTCFKT